MVINTALFPKVSCLNKYSEKLLWLGILVRHVTENHSHDWYAAKEGDAHFL